MKRRQWKKHLLSGICIILLLFLLQVFLVWFVPSVSVANWVFVARLRHGEVDVEQALHVRWDTQRKDHRRRPIRGRISQKPVLSGQQRPMGNDTEMITPAIHDDPSVQAKLSLLQQPWTPESRTALLQILEPSLFSDRIDPVSDSVCYLPAIKPPDMCGHTEWECSLDPTYVYHDRINRTLHVSCEGEFQINFISREESETRLPNHEFMPDREWHSYRGPTTVPFPSQYADVVCPKTVGEDIVDQHNYRTQFVRNVTSEKEQIKKFEKLSASSSDWQPLTILSINIDSMSRPHFHRPCGLPKTAQLIKDLYYSHTSGSTDSPSNHKVPSHQAFLFNRLNSVGGVTAMNLTPLYAGIYLRRSDEEKRVLLHRYPRKIKEWIWDYANSLGYLTSYGVDTGNGLFGTRTVCKTCTNRPGSLPHWEDGWVKRENEEVRPGVLAGLCDGDTFIHEHIMNYTQDFLNSDYPVKWAAFDVNAKHRPEPDSATQIDDSLVHHLKELMESQPNLVIFLFGDHGDRYHGNYTDHPGSYLEIFLPFLSIIVPRFVMEENPDWERNLLINSQRYVVHYDLHHTMKSLMHYPALHNVSGHLSKNSYNLFTQVVPRSRTCDVANMPYWSCVCGGPKFLPQDRWTDQHVSLARAAVDEINHKHSKDALLQQDATNKNLSTSCMDIQLANITSIAAYEHEYAGVFSAYYHIMFTSNEGPSVWQVTIDNQASVDSLKQVSRYRKYEDCQDYRVSIEFCICRQFPPGTP
ncbi:uncharacterized protein LOC119730765 [Patiria miniata]|uniref:Uncharacterized protein n=1 Tax=Patiria miniata TaxID=46514 RepID=A0A914A8I2_PATMI|nr:uncharacterized protein LOC119730765 [Patiria miniata]XP_038059719.1 uncharacterized protein LOC119730765 [Patiria miniata]